MSRAKLPGNSDIAMAKRSQILFALKFYLLSNFICSQILFASSHGNTWAELLEILLRDCRFPAVNAFYFVVGFSPKASVECKTFKRESPKLIGKVVCHFFKEVPANRDTFF